MVQRITRSPVLRSVPVVKGSHFHSNNKIFAGFDRAEVEKFDALALVLFLIAQYKGQVALPDGGFYLSDSHMNLIREKRLIAGVRFKRPACGIRCDGLRDADCSGATFKDAEELAEYEGLPQDRQHEDIRSIALWIGR
jgi:hypothetical protein